MEDLDRRAAAQQDPRGFFASFVNDPGVIIDEIQEVPELFSYMQGVVDEKYRPGFFIVTGSQQFSMHEKITQTLAGRIALLTLLPLSVNELKEAHLLPAQINSLFIKGFYPRVYAQNIEFELWFSNYISTYVEKDVRQVLQIADVVTFQRFLKLVAARVGNLVNYADLARDADISPNTAKAWLSVLEASYIIKLVAPYYKNFNKRVIKSPKLYFYDTALVCALLGIKESDVPFHPLRGALFESFVVSELFKYNFNHVYQPQLYFWRDVQGHEIDCVIEKSLETVIPVEIKAGMTVTEDFFKGLIDWADITDQKSVSTYVVYGGNDYREYKGIRVFPWNVIAQMLDEVYK
jgi:predicted AAA+ superfamily ATPase